MPYQRREPGQGPLPTLPRHHHQVRPADGFGTRTDAGYEAGDTVSQYYDNLVAKLVVWGADREEARRRMVRALRETEIEGVATTIPAHLAILEHPDFAAGEHSTKWVEERLDLSGVAAPAKPAADDEAEGAEPTVARDVDVEVDGRRYHVRMWVPDVEVVAASAANKPRKRPAISQSGGGAASSDKVTVPMQGTIVKVLVAVGDHVEVGQTVCVLEAMKMENHINAERAGTISEIRVEAGATVGAGDIVAVIA